ncbi:hypothetical protein M8818_003704 [Zalaria obscura]|uniref:Uncharacterized protein n=1 Tax=Zalaria obscura TaxID=2024903 RepID=A0ACC3SE17_9PEZI
MSAILRCEGGKSGQISLVSAGIPSGQPLATGSQRWSLLDYARRPLCSNSPVRVSGCILWAFYGASWVKRIFPRHVRDRLSGRKMDGWAGLQVVLRFVKSLLQL